MTERVFVDSNVLVYRRDVRETEKQSRAAEWVEHLARSRLGRVSIQVLHEYYATVTRKLDPGIPVEEARADVTDYLVWRPVPLEAGLLRDAWRAEDRFGLPFWDALIVAAARDAGCRYLLTEDLQDGQDLDDVRVVDPFHTAPDELA